MFIDELLKYEDMNVVFVDWSAGSSFPYHQAYGNIRLVGIYLSVYFLAKSLVKVKVLYFLFIIKYHTCNIKYHTCNIKYHTCNIKYHTCNIKYHTCNIKYHTCNIK